MEEEESVRRSNGWAFDIIQHLWFYSGEGGHGSLGGAHDVEVDIGFNGTRLGSWDDSRQERDC